MPLVALRPTAAPPRTFVPMTKAICQETHSLWLQMGAVELNTLLAQMSYLPDSNARVLKKGLQRKGCVCVVGVVVVVAGLDKNLNHSPKVVLL